DPDGVNDPPLLRARAFEIARRRGRATSGGHRIERLVPKRAPEALERTRIGIEHDDATVTVTIGNHRLVRLLDDLHVRRLVEIRGVLVSLTLIAASDLLHEFALARELEQHVV